MMITMSGPIGADFDLNNSDNGVPLVPPALEKIFQKSLAGYEIIQGYASTVKMQPYLAVEGVPSLEKTQAHARTTVEFWISSVSVEINKTYEKIRNLKVLQDDILGVELESYLARLENVEDRSNFIELLTVYIEETESIENALQELIEKLNVFRSLLEEDARNYGSVLSEIGQQVKLDNKTILDLREQLESINKKIDELNNTITEKKVAREEIKRKMGIGLIFLLSIPGMIALSIFKGQEKDMDAQINMNGKTLAESKQSLNEKSTALAKIEVRVAYLNTLQSEFTKLKNNCVHAAIVVINMRDAWVTLTGNLKNIVTRLSSVKNINFDKSKVLLNIQLKALKKSIEKLNTDIEIHNQSKLIQVPIDEDVRNLLQPNRTRLHYVPMNALPARLLHAYTDRMHFLERVKNKEYHEAKYYAQL